MTLLNLFQRACITIKMVAEYKNTASIALRALMTLGMASIQRNISLNATTTKQHSINYFFF